LKAYLRQMIETLLARGTSTREIARRTGVDRKTIRSYAGVYAAAANSPGVATGSAPPANQIPPPRPPGPDGGTDVASDDAAPPPTTPTSAPPSGAARSVSACEPHRAWIEAQLQLGRNATSIYQELVDAHGFASRYNSVKRFVATLRAREPERFDVLEFLPGEEAQVDYGQGALTLVPPSTRSARRSSKPTYKRPMLFVMTLKYSGKSFRQVVWRTNQEIWAQLHEEAFHALGGCCQYVVLDNLREGVLRSDLYEPTLNPVYAALLAHYGVIADPCRVGDPNRKGTVENAIQHTQGTALKGKRFDTLEAQNAWLARWEERWAAPRIHGRKKRQVVELYQEELPHLRPLPAERFRFFKQESRTVDDGGLVQVGGSYYAALPAAPHGEVTVRIYEHDLEILDRAGQVLRRHAKALRKGSFTLEHGDRLFNPSRETARLLSKARQIGPHTASFAHELFARHGRPGQRALYGLTNLTRTYARLDVEAVCGRLLKAECFSYAAVKRALERVEHTRLDTIPSEAALRQSDAAIRPIAEYQAFWETHAPLPPPTPSLTPSPPRPEDASNAHVDP
jgi:transposase